MLFAYSPSSLAIFSKAAELYQPADAVLLPEAGFSKNRPIVAAPQPNAAAILDESP